MRLHRQLLTLRCSSCHQGAVTAGRCGFNAWSPHLVPSFKPLPLPACLTGAPHPILTSLGGTLPQSLAWGSQQDRTQECLKIVMSPWGQRAVGLRNTLRSGFIHCSQVNVLFSFISPFLCPNRGWLFHHRPLSFLYWDQKRFSVFGPCLYFLQMMHLACDTNDS